jgi:transcriptional regulator with XRE-family HTH domain
MHSAAPALRVVYEVAKKATTVGMIACTAAPATAALSGLVMTRSWTEHPMQLIVGAPLQSTTGPLRFEDAIDGNAVLVGVGASGVAASDSVRSIYERSGLTWEQLARLFGVSRRAVHSWASGSRVSARHLEAIFDLAGQLARRVATPDENRAWLMDSSAGASPYEQIRQRNARTPMEPRLSAGELMGIG